MEALVIIALTAASKQAGNRAEISHTSYENSYNGQERLTI
jgi:hypothetical protein